MIRLKIGNAFDMARRYTLIRAEVPRLDGCDFNE
jgi:hypothetical protein